MRHSRSDPAIDRARVADQPPQNTGLRILGRLAGAGFEAALIDYRGALHHPSHVHHEPILTLLIAGHAEETVASATVVAPPLTVGFKPPGIRHADRFADAGVRALRITLEAPMLSAAEEAGGGAREWTWIARSSAVAPLLRIAARLAGTGAYDTQDDLHEALAAMAQHRERPVPHREPPSWLGRVRERLDDGEGSRLSELAQGAGVHPVYLARRFRCHYGCSVDEYIQWRRTAAAAALLRGSKPSLAVIATEVGCSDQSHLTRIVRAATGVTPAALRRLLTFAHGAP